MEFRSRNAGTVIEERGAYDASRAVGNGRAVAHGRPSAPPMTEFGCSFCKVPGERGLLAAVRRCRFLSRRIRGRRRYTELHVRDPQR